ncbi:MAG: FAD-binding protein, partial [Syntrophales bacterium]|nr:FAD-binding protein [Syntrophales bacterium]
MLSLSKHNTNQVIIIGAGLAGIMAALAAHEEGADVILIDRGPIGTGTNSALANGMFSTPNATYDSEAYIRNTMETGRHLNNNETVRLVAREAPQFFPLLRSMGIPVREYPDRQTVESPVSGTIPGVTMMRKLAEKVLSLDRLRIMKGFYSTDLVVENGRILGIKGIDKTGEEIYLPSPAVILATGGAGAIYGRNDNQKKI